MTKLGYLLTLLPLTALSIVLAYVPESEPALVIFWALVGVGCGWACVHHRPVRVVA